MHTISGNYYVTGYYMYKYTWETISKLSSLDFSFFSFQACIKQATALHGTSASSRAFNMHLRIPRAMLHRQVE